MTNVRDVAVREAGLPDAARRVVLELERIARALPDVRTAAEAVRLKDRADAIAYLARKARVEREIEMDAMALRVATEARLVRCWRSSGRRRVAMRIGLGSGRRPSLPRRCDSSCDHSLDFDPQNGVPMGPWHICNGE